LETEGTLGNGVGDIQRPQFLTPSVGILSKGKNTQIMRIVTRILTRDFYTDREGS
jgi:hypothetical protein